MLITAKLECPSLLTFGRGRRKRFFAQEAQLFTFHFTASWIEPDFVPVIAGDCGLACGVRLDRFALDGLSLATIVVAALLLDIVVVPRVVMTGIPVVKERSLIDDYFD